MSFNNSVFINCPFDDEYKELLNPLLFTVIHCGLTPKISETTDSGAVRIDKIISLIESSLYSIHDLSRVEPLLPGGELPRLNMPFELGLDIGCKKFKVGKWTNKRCLILEKEPHRYKKFISDISGSDIESHDNTPEKLVRGVRNWIFKFIPNQVSASGIWESYNIFLGYFAKLTGYSSDDKKNMPKSEFISIVTTWIAADKLKVSSKKRK